MELQDYVRIVRKRIGVILLVAVLTAAGAFAFSRIQTPIYRSTIMLNVIPARLDWGLLQTIQVYMRNYAGQIRSRSIASQVVDRLQLDITPEELAAKLTVSPIESDFLIQIDADDYDPVIAAQIAQTTAEVFVEKITVDMLELDKRDRVEISIRDNALPGVLHKPKWKVNTLAGGLFGVLLGVVIALVLERLEADTIRTTSDLERHVGIPVLGLIPTAPGMELAQGADRAPRQRMTAYTH